MLLSLLNHLNGDLSKSRWHMRKFLILWLILTVGRLPLFGALTPSCVENQKDADVFLKKTSAMLPTPGYDSNSFYFQLLRANEDYKIVPSLGFSGKLTDTYSFFVTGSAALNYSDPWYATSYGLSMKKNVSKVKGDVILRTTIFHADHPDWKNRIVALTGGGIYQGLPLHLGLFFSVNYENGVVRTNLMKYQSENFYLSTALTITWSGWQMTVRANGNTMGASLSKSILL